MKKIPLTQGKFAVVDDCDHEYLMQWKWCYDGRYAKRADHGATCYMHLVILRRMDYSPAHHLLVSGRLDYRRSILRPELDLSPGPKKISLTQGKAATVDFKDYEWLMKWRWQYDGRYARRTDYIMQKPVYMHRVILERMGLPCAEDTDHRDRDKLDNRRCQLRPATRGQSNANRKFTGGTSKYKGVCWNKACKKWTAQIGVDRRQRYLGNFDDEIEAARAYDEAAKKYFGEFARLNGV